MKTKKVLIQGIEGSNHHLAALAYFNEETIEVEACNSFRELFARLDSSSEFVGLVAMENTLAGSLLGNYTLLRQSGKRVLGEYKMRISHQLLALPGQQVTDLQEVHSHPMALAQCEDFLLQHPFIRLVESEDTALSAKIIQQQQIKGRAAIASMLAGELFGLELMAENIETNPHNFTRFLVIGNEDVPPLNLPEEGRRLDKSSLVFSLPHESGSLSKILSMLSYFSLNLTKIQSLPVVGREWEYLFYVDFTFSDYALYNAALEAIKPFCQNLQVLGEYQTHESRIQQAITSESQSTYLHEKRV